MSDPVPEDVSRALSTTAHRRGTFGTPLYYFLEAGSTNDIAASLAEQGAAQGTTVLAGSQTAGRGRFSRIWFSPPGAGLYVSVICRHSRAAPLLTLAGGVAVADGIRNATGLPVQIKWPNDVVVEPDRGPRRKLAGILAEATSTPEGLQYVILGFGINLRSAAYPPELTDRVTSIEVELGRVVDANVVLAETLAVLAERCAQLERGDSAQVLSRWRELSPSCRGAAIEWDTASGPVSGIAAGIDDDGALRVRVGQQIERIISGEVRWK
jgi:BirA family transcriptional regulator, biotin operon repressor / biotin---[acetyl-CoA-carboxylase] ligase